MLKENRLGVTETVLFLFKDEGAFGRRCAHLAPLGARGHSVLTGGVRLCAYSVYPLGWATLGWGRGPELLPSSRPLGRSGGVGLSWALGG